MWFWNKIWTRIDPNIAVYEAYFEAQDEFSDNYVVEVYCVGKYCNDRMKYPNDKKKIEGKEMKSVTLNSHAITSPKT